MAIGSVLGTIREAEATTAHAAYQAHAAPARLGVRDTVRCSHHRADAHAVWCRNGHQEELCAARISA
jgi:hypothetical protein